MDIPILTAGIPLVGIPVAGALVVAGCVIGIVWAGKRLSTAAADTQPVEADNVVVFPPPMSADFDDDADEIEALRELGLIEQGVLRALNELVVPPVHRNPRAGVLFDQEADR